MVNAPCPNPADAASSDDHEIVDAIRCGDERAFEHVMRLYAEMLYTFAGGYVRSPDVARNVVQETFIALWEGRTRLVVRGALGAYLHQAVRFRCLNVLRRSRLEARYETKVTTGEIPVPTTTDPWTDMETSEDIARAVATLPERQRQVVQLRWEAGLPYSAIAEQMKITVKGVEFHMRRAIAALRVALR